MSSRCSTLRSAHWSSSAASASTPWKPGDPEGLDVFALALGASWPPRQIGQDGVRKVTDAGEGDRTKGRELFHSHALIYYAAVCDRAASVTGIDKAPEILVVLGDAGTQIGVGLVEQQRASALAHLSEQRSGRQVTVCIGRGTTRSRTSRVRVFPIPSPPTAAQAEGTTRTLRSPSNAPPTRPRHVGAAGEGKQRTATAGVEPIQHQPAPQRRPPPRNGEQGEHGEGPTLNLPGRGEHREHRERVHRHRCEQVPARRAVAASAAVSRRRSRRHRQLTIEKRSPASTSSPSCNRRSASASAIRARRRREHGSATAPRPAPAEHQHGAVVGGDAHQLQHRPSRCPRHRLATSNDGNAGPRHRPLLGRRCATGDRRTDPRRPLGKSARSSGQRCTASTINRSTSSTVTTTPQPQGTASDQSALAPQRRQAAPAQPPAPHGRRSRASTSSTAEDTE